MLPISETCCQFRKHVANFGNMLPISETCCQFRKYVVNLGNNSILRIYLCALFKHLFFCNNYQIKLFSRVPLTTTIMKVLIACVITLSLISSAVGAAVTAANSVAASNSFTSASFNSTPVKILNVANSTAANIDAAWAGYMYGTVGPAAANTSLYLWGYSYTAAAAVIPTIVRKLSATIIAYGNDTTEMSTVSGTTDTVQTVSLGTNNMLRQTTPVVGVAPGALAIAAVQGLTQAAGVMDYLVLYVVTPSGITSKTIATATADVSTTTYYSFAVNQVWYEDSCYFILYESQTDVTATPTYSVTSIQVAAYCTGNTTVIYATSANVASSSSMVPTALGTPATGAKAQNSNITNSTSIYVIWNDMSGTYTVVKTAILARNTGTASTAAAALVTGTATTTTYGAAGIVTSMSGTYGWLVGTYFNANTSSVVNAYYNASSSYTITNLTLSGTQTAVTSITGMGFHYGTGFAIVLGYPSSSTANTYITQTYYNNGTYNTTSSSSQLTLGTFLTTSGFATTVSSFADANGAFWTGLVYADSTATPQQINSAYAGILYGQINATTSTSSSAGSILASLAALVSFVIMSLFMF